MVILQRDLFALHKRAHAFLSNHCVHATGLTFHQLVPCTLKLWGRKMATLAVIGHLKLETLAKAARWNRFTGFIVGFSMALPNEC